MKTKEELLAELKKYDVDPTKKIRKPRSDIGEPRVVKKERADKGKIRGSYINTAAKYKAVYERMLQGHATGGGDDNLTRDKNDIFPPNINRYYRKFVGKDREYTASVVKPAHLEQARWRWLMAEYAEDPDKWRAHIAKWYFILETDIGTWMYTEWAWAYVHYINGEENRLTATPKQLIYYHYVEGKYNGYPDFDNRGEIIWTNK